MKRLFSIFFLLFLPLSCLFAQGEAGLGLRVVVPTGTFRQASDAWGGGVALNALFNIGGRGSVLMLGGELSYTLYGHSTQNFTVNIANAGWASFNRRYELEVNNNMFMGHLVGRIKPDLDGNIHPYADGLFGFNYLYTNANLRDITLLNNNNNNNDTQTRNTLSDITLSYGGAVGIQFGGGNIKFDVKCYYLFGGNADYYDRSSVRYTTDNNGTVNANFSEPKSSKTDVIIPQIGLIVMF